MILSDENLIRAYVEIDVPLDDLAYRPALDDLIRRAHTGVVPDDDLRRIALKRIGYLRRRGRLPRLRRRLFA